MPSPTAALMAGEGELMLFIKIKFKVSIENVISEPKIEGAISSIITNYLYFSVDYYSSINNYDYKFIINQ